MTLLLDREDVRAAHARIAPHIRRTPVMPLARADLDLPGLLTLKLDLFQHSGSFKVRGAFSNLIARQAPAAGVAAASGGNHGAAVAYAARALGLKARIFVPEISSPVKVERIRSLGAEVVVGGARYADAQLACDALVAETGALAVHPFDSALTIAGQGTIGLEWEEDGAPIDTVLVAVGGGGLVAGITAWWAGKVKVVGVEPEGSRCLHAALEAGRPVDVSVESIAADSLGAKRTGDTVFENVKGRMDHVALVPDDAIAAAQRLLWDRVRLATEPGGCASLAALVCGAYRPEKDERVGVLLCGANVDPRVLA